MGIGRASGENRAVVAAQQAIESPLLEVSIDGARGILFNVIGGNDLSMHEINAAAETITTAADSDANIIFGATINPELDGEIIITVVATGFDASYFAKRQEDGDESMSSGSAPTPLSTQASSQDDSAIREIDMNLDDTPVTDFTSDAPLPNIWTIEDDDAPEANRNDDSDDDHHSSGSVVTGSLDDDLEKPSFLRRLAKRRREEKPVDDTDKTS